MTDHGPARQLTDNMRCDEPTPGAARHLDLQTMQEQAETATSGLLAHAKDLRTLAACLTRDDAADLVQDTWVAALAARSRPRTAGTWLREVMRNQFRGGLRSRLRRRAREQQYAPDEVVAGPDDAAVETELVLAMQEALDGVGEPYRAVLHARFFAGHTPTEIALAVGRPPATVRWQLHEGLRRIRDGLDARYGDRRHWHGGVLAIATWPYARAQGATTMTRFATLKWFAGLSVATGATAVVLTQSSMPAGAQVTLARPDEPTQARGFEPIVHPVLAEVGSAPQPESAPNLAHDAPCAGGCDGADAVPFRAVLSNDDELAATFAACENLVPADARTGRFEIDVTVRGGPDGVGNTITGVSVTRGRKLPCIDPDAGFDEPDGPDVVRFAAVAECIEHSLLPTFIEELPDNELRSMAAVLHDDAPAAAAAAALPAPSAEAKTIDPAQAIAHFGLRGSSEATDPKVSVVECGGYDCSFCNRARETVAELRKRYGDALSFHFLQMPLDMHPTGSVAARAAVAAALQGKSWEMHELLFDEPSLRTEAALIERAATLGLDADRFAHDLTDPATAQSVADQREVCTAAGARGTPSFFINGDLLVGSQAIDAFVEIIDDELAAPGA